MDEFHILISFKNNYKIYWKIEEPLLQLVEDSTFVMQQTINEMHKFFV